MAVENMYAKKIDKEARLRHKLVSNELNPVADAILSILLLCMTPFIWLFALMHDKVMFKFLNKTFIYNVSWEVRLTFTVLHEVTDSIIFLSLRILVWISVFST